MNIVLFLGLYTATLCSATRVSNGETVHIPTQFVPPVFTAMTMVVESVASLALMLLKSSLQKLPSQWSSWGTWRWVSKLQSPSHRAVMFILVANWNFFFFLMLHLYLMQIFEARSRYRTLGPGGHVLRVQDQESSA